MASNYKLIARNSLFLYLRLLVVALVGLITSRLLLQALGIRGYGLYTVVCGLVIMMTFLQNSMLSTSQRFMNVELGRGDTIAQKEVFKACLFIHRHIAFILLFFAETIGLWYLNFIMNVHDDELYTANVVFQLAIYSFIANILNSPYRSVIIVHERMDILAYITIFEVIIRCVVAFGLLYAPYNRVILYTACLLLLNISLLFIYIIIAKKNYSECRDSKVPVNKKRVRELMSFSGWIVFGALGTQAHVHGIALAVNMFFGLAANAALGVANQVAAVVKQFVTSFMTALGPQIVKSYAQQEFDNTKILVKQGCKMGLYLASILVVPIFIEAPTLLRLWLVDVPPSTFIFVRLNMIMILFWSLTSPLTMAQWATGKIKKYQITITSLSLSHLPLTLLFFEFDYKAPMALYLYIVLMAIMQCCRIYFVCNVVGMKKREFINDVVFKSTIMILLASIMPLFLHGILRPSFFTSFIVFITNIGGLSCLLYVIVLSKTERESILRMVRKVYLGEKKESIIPNSIYAEKKK